MGTLNPFSTPARTFAAQLDRHLYHGATFDRLVNWGYAVADAGLRAHVVPDAAPPAGFPFAKAGVG